MTERNYFFIIGVVTCIFLYFETLEGLYALMAVLLFESIFNIRIPKTVQKMMHQSYSPDMKVPQTKNRFSVSASRAWHFVYATIVLCSTLAINLFGIGIVWFIPWFMAIAALSAAITSMCPLYAILVYVGFAHK